MQDDEDFEAIRKGMDGPTEMEEMSQSQLMSMAASHHELWQSHVDAGFTDSMAAYMTAVVLTGSPGKPPKT